MKNLIKVINYTDGGKLYNQVEILEMKAYGVAKISFIEAETEQYSETVWFDIAENKFGLTESELLYVRMPILETELNTLTVSKLDDFIAQIELTDETDIVVPQPRLKEDKIQAILDFEGII